MSTREISTVSISSKFIDKCDVVARMLQENGILSKISENKTIEKDLNRFVVNTGCEITFTNSSFQQVKQEIWPQLKEKFVLNCGHIKTNKGFSGCINDFLKHPNP